MSRNSRPRLLVDKIPIRHHGREICLNYDCADRRKMKDAEIEKRCANCKWAHDWADHSGGMDCIVYSKAVNPANKACPNWREEDKGAIKR